MTKSLELILKLAPVMPVLVIEEVADALPLASALVRGGLPVLEITLRTDKALDCIRAIMGEIEGAVVGAGTVLNADQLAQVEKIGCAFAVSPGATPALVEAAADWPCPARRSDGKRGDAALGTRLSFPEILSRRIGRRLLSQRSLRRCRRFASVPQGGFRPARLRPIWRFPMSSPLAVPG